MRSQIPSQQTSLPDPFSDITCGGWEISEEPRGRLSLWAVSLQGKVLLNMYTVTRFQLFAAVEEHIVFRSVYSNCCCPIR